LTGKLSAIVAIYQLPGSNAVQASAAVNKLMAEMKQRFPEDIDYVVSLDQTSAVTEGMKEIVQTLAIAIVLVIVVVYLFLQDWRATLIPLLAVPVSLVGTFVFFPLFGFSINTLSLFGLVLAIGLVVDDAIVVVEGVQRHIEEGLAPKDAARKAMEELSGPVIGIALVLSSVFVPTAFIPGITGKLYQQFAVTIAISVVRSAFNALTLSPALAALLLKPHVHGEHGHVQQEALPRLGIGIIGGLAAYMFLLTPIGHAFGIEVGGHGAETAAHTSTTVLLALRAVAVRVVRTGVEPARVPGRSDFRNSARALPDDRLGASDPDSRGAADRELLQLRRMPHRRRSRRLRAPLLQGRSDQLCAANPEWRRRQGAAAVAIHLPARTNADSAVAQDSYAYVPSDESGRRHAGQLFHRAFGCERALHVYQYEPAGTGGIAGRRQADVEGLLQLLQLSSAGR